MSGRLVAARMTMPSLVSKPSISASIWLSVCSRSSWPPPRPAPRLRPIESISSTKMIARPILRACWNRSRTRLAPTPTNISMKSEPVTDRNPTPASPATARANRVLPVPGGPTSRMPFGHAGADLAEALGHAQEVDDFGDLLLDALVAGDVGERGRRLVGRVGLGPAAPDRHHVAHLARSAPLHPHEEPDDQHERQQQAGPAEQPVGARRLGLELDVLGLRASALWLSLGKLFGAVLVNFSPLVSSPLMLLVGLLTVDALDLAVLDAATRTSLNGFLSLRRRRPHPAAGRTTASARRTARG